MCSVTCPKGLDPRASLQSLISMVQDFQENRIANETLWVKFVWLCNTLYWINFMQTYVKKLG